MGDLVQAVFEEISLERDPRLWQSEKDTVAEAAKRIKFLAEFPETSFSEVIPFFPLCLLLFTRL